MKLIFCPECWDLRRLHVETPTYCKCRKSMGMYTDNVYAVIAGYAIPVGISNYSFRSALMYKDVFAGFFYGEDGHGMQNKHISEISVKEFRQMVRNIKEREK